MAETLEKNILINLGIQAADINELNEKLSIAKTKLKEAKFGTEDFAKAKTEVNKLTAAIKGVTKEVEYQKGSMKQLNAELGKNRDAYRALSQAERENAAIGGKLLTTIQQQDAEIKKLDATIGNHQRKVGDYSGALKGFGTSILAAFGIGGAVMVVTNVFKGIISSTQGFGDDLTAIIEGMSFSYNSFLKTIATGDWSNLHNNMKTAYEAGVKYAKMLDELTEKNYDLSINQAKSNLEISKLERISKDKTKSDLERLQATDKIIKIENDLVQKNKQIKQDAYDAELIAIEGITRMSKIEFENFTENYIESNKLREEAIKLINLQNLSEGEYAGTSGYGAAAFYETQQKKKEALKELTNELSKNSLETGINIKQVEDYAKLYRKYNLSTDEVIKKAVDARINLINVETQYFDEGRKNALIKEKALEDIRNENEEELKLAKTKADKLKEIKDKEQQQFIEDYAAHNAEILAEDEALQNEKIAREKLLNDTLKQDNQDLLDYKLWVANEEATAEYERLKKLAADKKALKEKELQDTKDNLSRSLEAIGLFQSAVSLMKDKELMEAEGNAQQQKEIRKKYADREANLAILEASISGALGVLNIISGKATGNVIADAIIKGVLIAGTVAETTAQISTINAQRDQIKSLSGGGFTGPGVFADPNVSGQKVAGVVHQNEFVASETLVKKFPDLFLALDKKQKGFADGGFTSRSISNDIISSTRSNSQITDLITNMPAPIVLVEEIDNGISKRVKVRNRASL